MTIHNFKIGPSAFSVDDFDQPGTLPMLALKSGVAAANKYSAEREAVMNNDRLSAVGKAEEIAPLTDRIWAHVLRQTGNIIGDKDHWQGLEDKLLAVQAAGAAQEQRDAEVRSWFRSLSPADRQQAINDAERAPDDYNEVIQALLRSPIPEGLDREKKQVRELHLAAQRLIWPGHATDIADGQRANVEATRGSMHVAGILHVLTERTPREVAAQAVALDMEPAAALLVGNDPVRRARHAAYIEKARAA